MRKQTLKKMFAALTCTAAAMQSMSLCGMTLWAEEADVAVDTGTVTTTAMTTTTMDNIIATEYTTTPATTIEPTFTTTPVYTETTTVETTTVPMFTTTADPVGSSTTDTEPVKQYFNLSVRLYETTNNTLLPGAQMRLVKYDGFIPDGYDPSVTGEVITEWNSTDGDSYYLIENIEFEYGSYYRVEGDLPEGYILEGIPYTYSRVFGGTSVPQNVELVLYSEKIPDYLADVQFPLEGTFNMKITLIDDATNEYFTGLDVTIYQVLNNQTEIKAVASGTAENGQVILEVPYYMENSADSCLYNYIISGLPEGYTNYGNDVSTPHHYVNFSFDKENLRIELESGAPYADEITCILHKDYENTYSGLTGTTPTFTTTTTITTADIIDTDISADNTQPTTSSALTDTIPPSTATTTTTTTTTASTADTTTVLPQTGYDSRYQLLIIAAGGLTILGMGMMLGIILDNREKKN